MMIINPFVFGSGSPTPPPDPYLANRVSMLHLDGNATDVSGKVWTPNATLPYNTTTPLYGTGSLGPITALGQALTSPVSADFTFGTGDFTVELAFRFPTGSTYAGKYFFDGISGATGNLTVIQFNPTGNLAYYDPVTGAGSGALYANGPSAVSLADGLRHTVAISKVSGTIYAFCDGVMWGSQASSHNKTQTQVRLNGYGAALNLGCLNAVFDELRITKGVGRYTSNYIPSSLPFSDV